MLGTSHLGFGWGGWGGTKASLMLGTRVGSMDLNHHLTQPFRVWLGGGGETKAFTFLCTQMHCTLIACHQKHCTLNIVLGRGGGDKSIHFPLRTKALHLDRLSSEALHLEHSLGQGRGGQKHSFSSAHKSTAP